jgi:hypothetical protein
MLTLFCRDPVGKALWDFADMAGRASVDWLLRCASDEYDAYLAREETNPSLFPVQFEPSINEINRIVDERAAAYLPGHVADLIRRKGTCRLQDDPASVYGEQLGMARAKHVSAAVERLVDRGLVERRGAAQIRNAVLRWTGGEISAVIAD